MGKATSIGLTKDGAIPSPLGKNEDEVSLELVDDLSVFLKNYIARNGSEALSMLSTRIGKSPFRQRLRN